MLDRFMASFREEARELLDELESSLLELERYPFNAESIGRVFRAMHTIKGLGSSFGYEGISCFSHEVESVFALVRSGILTVDRELIDLTLRARDWISAVLEEKEGTGEAEGRTLAEAFRRISGTADGPAMTERGSGTGAGGDDSAGGRIICRVRFRPSPEIFLTGPDPLCLFNELRQLGECSVIAHLHDIPALESIIPEHCYTYWDILLTTCHGINAVRDVFIFVEDTSEIKIDILHEDDVSGIGPVCRRLGEILVERGDLAPQDVERCLSRQKRLGEIALEEGLVSPSQVESALAEQEAVREAGQRGRGQEAEFSLRVASDKLDRLVDLVGELVTASARLNRINGLFEDPRLGAVAEEIESLTGELRDTTLNIRMIPIGETFGRFRRVVRDLGRDLGKEVEFLTSGEETGLDKTVIDKLHEPLVHIIRNSIDHGIEEPSAREAAGKSRQGMVVLTAVHAADSVVITVRDDGAGLDAEAIRRAAVRMGIVKPDAELTEKELFSLIFIPGFSTSGKVTGVSGRGVGMDVVKRAIDGLRGNIEIGSRQGAGTVITIRLPLTLAIIESLLVKVGSESFVLPLSAVEECIEHVTAAGREARLADVRGSLIPYIPLRDFFSVPGTPPEIQQIVVIRVEEERIGFAVDSVVGEHQTVIKSLGRLCREVTGVSGATILGDGTVALILDVPAIVMCGQESRLRTRGAQ